jgi:hypothetical protein
MKTSPRQRFYWTVGVVLLVGWIMIGLWESTDSNIFIFLLFAWIFIGTWLIRAVKCPYCGEPVSLQGQIGGVAIHASTARKFCKNCGHDLTVSVDDK